MWNHFKFSDSSNPYITTSNKALWQGFFEEYGRKYGLIREFRENGIL